MALTGFKKIQIVVGGPGYNGVPRALVVQQDVGCRWFRLAFVTMTTAVNCDLGAIFEINTLPRHI